MVNASVANKQKGGIVIVLCLVLTLTPLFVTAYEMDRMELRPYLFHSFDQRSQNWSIAQDPSTHVMYFANSEGLLRFNGISWETYTHSDQTPIRAVNVDSSGNIFTGAFEEFGFWKPDDCGDLAYHSLTHKVDVERNDEIWKIYFDDDKVYFQTFTSIYVYDYDSVEKHKAPYVMLFLFQSGDQFIAQVLNSGLFWFDDNGFRFIENSGIFADKKVHAIIPYLDNKLMVCTDNDGLYLFDDGQFSYFPSEASDFLRRSTCNTAMQLNDTTYAFGSILNGVIITDQNGRIQESYNVENGLGNNTVLSLYEDAEQGLWIGLDHGVQYLDLLSPYTHFKSKNGTLGTIYALLEHDDWLYIGTNHGLFRTSIEKTGNRYHFREPEFIPDSHGQVWTLINIGEQIICGHNDGTFLVKDDTLEQLSEISGGWSYIPYKDYILGSTYTGIIVLETDDQGQIRFRHTIENYSQPTRYLETDYLGYVWASHHRRGINRIELYDNKQIAKEVVHYPGIDDQYFNIRVFKINNRIVFATGENIYTFDFVRNEIIPFTALTEHLGKYGKATQIIHHQENRYWFVKENALALFELGLDFEANMQYEIVHEGIQLPHRNIQLAFPDEHSILIPNPYGIDVYDMTLHGVRDEDDRLALEYLRFHGRKDTLAFPDTFDEVSVPWHANNLEVSFRDPSHFNKSEQNYDYRIRELGSVWQSTSNGHFSLMGLRHGSYTLDIRADEDNVITREFVIRKPWFYSHTAIVIYLLLFLLIMWGIYVFFRFELKQHKDLVLLELNQKNLERELDYKSHELMFTIRHLIQKDNILNSLQKHIKAIKEQYARYPVKHIKKMESIIKESLGYQNIEWENAAKNLKLSQQGFFKKLKEKYPDLTPNDLRLCAYLRLNLTTKEIAQLLNISPRGVEISRHRLRKKLMLKKDENLYEFLMYEETDISEKHS
ncbi:MAG: hypothetical protein R6U62_08320 [Bacteroidales bacterium]